ncbi:MAG TPA: discoidin domain-containing protein [Myxococcota bacterium]|nr:discoidin domain-containing protein [Myxococcota bacterium]
MAVISCMIVCIGLSSMALAQDEAGLTSPTLLVHSFKDPDRKLKPASRLILEDYLRSQISSFGKFTVIATAEVERALSQIRVESHRDCVDDRCQIELGEILSASQALSITVMALDRNCGIIAHMNDVRRSAMSGSAEAMDVSCDRVGLMKGLRMVAAILSGQPVPPDVLPPPPPPVEPIQRIQSVQPVQQAPVVARPPSRLHISSVRVSSELPSPKNYNAARNAIDGRPDTWWGEGAGGDGIGEWIEAFLGRQVEIREVRLIPGYQKSLPDKFGDRWPLNNRLRKVRVELDDGSSFAAELSDRKGFHSIAIPSGNYSRSVRIVILEVFPGYNQKGERIQDSGIAEIQILGVE